MIVMLDVILGLVAAPIFVVAFELQALR